jgi:geranylgeranyl diphosphate synthase type 3
MILNSVEANQVNLSLFAQHVCSGGMTHSVSQVAHRIYGVPQTINTANYVYFLAYQELLKLRNQDSETRNLDFIVTGVD